MFFLWEEEKTFFDFLYCRRRGKSVLRRKTQISKQPKEIKVCFFFIFKGRGGLSNGFRLFVSNVRKVQIFRTVMSRWRSRSAMIFIFSFFFGGSFVAVVVVVCNLRRRQRNRHVNGKTKKIFCIVFTAIFAFTFRSNLKQKKIFRNVGKKKKGKTIPRNVNVSCRCHYCNFFCCRWTLRKPPLPPKKK